MKHVFIIKFNKYTIVLSNIYFIYVCVEVVLLLHDFTLF